MTSETDIQRSYGAAGARLGATTEAEEREAYGSEAPPVRRSRLRRLVWRSTLTRRILLVNVLVLVIPVMGLLHLEEYRASLIQAELEAMRTQARTFSFALAGSSVVVSPKGDERLVEATVQNVMRVLLRDSVLRARLFARDGEMIADSFRLTGPAGGQVEVQELPAPDSQSFLSRMLDRGYSVLFNWLPGATDLPIYKEQAQQRAEHYEEVMAALVGETPGRARVDRQGGLVLSVAVPVQRYRQVLGALMLSKGGSDIEAAVANRRADILMIFAVALAVTILLSFYLAGTIARPIRRLAEAADRVRRAKGWQARIPNFTRRGDEIGDLSGTLIEMTEALWRRLDAIERFAADVAHEIKNPLTSVRSAVETVARIDDPAQQKKLMAIILDDVQRLDRLISDISDASRLDTELARANTEPVDIGQLLGALSEVYGTAEGHLDIVVDLPERESIVVPGIEARLGQVFRNLIANAVSFSPPDGRIRLSAWKDSGQAVVTVDDEGPGIPENKLNSIFDRFYTERPKGEKFGTHSGLGLSISRQIIEAHGGEIRAENRRDANGRISGARFIVRLPLEERRGL
ncbi:MAG: stimulus-sensing domain-containing protein [Rhodovibrionaceae bacterium]|nr:stimulus-sensing domain-containing protein [Rhodovibrionaceae bacterium]